MKLIIDIPDRVYEGVKALIAINFGGRFSGKGLAHDSLRAIKNGIPLETALEMLKVEIRDNTNHCECVPNGSCIRVDTVLETIDKHLCKTGSEDIGLNDMTHMFDGVTEMPKDAFKGWTTNELLEQIRGKSEGT